MRRVPPTSRSTHVVVCASALAASVAIGCAAGPTDVVETDAARAARDASLDAPVRVLDANVDAPLRDALVATNTPRFPDAGSPCDTVGDCDDHDECTTDACEELDGIGYCQNPHIAGCVHDAGTDAGHDGGYDEDEPGPVDPSCDLGGGSIYYPPFVELGSVSTSCGFEWQNCVGSLVLESESSSGSSSTHLVVDIATYRLPDRLRIVAHGDDGSTVLLDTCRMQTNDYGDPTDGMTRPPDDSIRRFEVDVPDGTTSLTFDDTEATTPWYERVTGLCDFRIESPSGSCATSFRET